MMGGRTGRPQTETPVSGADWATRTQRQAKSRHDWMKAKRNDLCWLVIALGPTLGGCCTQLQDAPSAAVEDREWGTDLHWCDIFSGYGTAKEPDRYRALYTPVTANEYARILCEDKEIEQYASCMNQVRDFAQRLRGGSSRVGSSTSGPFAMKIGGNIYLGSYAWAPFDAWFRVSDGDGRVCRGSYSAFKGDTEPVFDVVCDSGLRGKADIVSGRDGRNGIGYVEMTDGTKGRILYGPNVAAAARDLR